MHNLLIADDKTREDGTAVLNMVQREVELSFVQEETMLKISYYMILTSLRFNESRKDLKHKNDKIHNLGFQKEQ